MRGWGTEKFWVALLARPWQGWWPYRWVWIYTGTKDLLQMTIGLLESVPVQPRYRL